MSTTTPTSAPIYLDNNATTRLLPEVVEADPEGAPAGRVRESRQSVCLRTPGAAGAGDGSRRYRH